jgi:hypothetical protein
MKRRYSERWFSPGKRTGWSKRLPATERRRLALKAHKGSYLSAGRALQALSNVTTDWRTKVLAGQDARYFFRMNK